ncbi:tRNA-guanine transglycosylase DpdA [Magnetococcales bacterium HHB-1]
MKFFYADSLDYVDPKYNFLEDRYQADRQPYWDDHFPHEVFQPPPYDGLLVSRGIVGDHKFSGKYTQSQAMRFRRVGARAFFRLNAPQYDHLDIFGDCGAFSYSDRKIPPYTPEEILEFYQDGGFSHGCSVDHIIFQFQRELTGMTPLSDPKEHEVAKERFDITLENANAFLKHATTTMPRNFTPLGVVQGWSPGSMGEAARSLTRMGYNYLAIGGLVPLSVKSVHIALQAIREQIPEHTRLHLLGFGKIDHINDFLGYNIASIDTTSPLIRAFKDNRRNFFMPGKNGKLEYYTALRIPHALESRKLALLVKKGFLSQEKTVQLEKEALRQIRKFDKGQTDEKTTLDALMAYTKLISIDPKSGQPNSFRTEKNIQLEYARMLHNRPWQRCKCQICQDIGIEVAIFRGSNRNKRRGMHNLHVFNTQLKKLSQQGSPP